VSRSGISISAGLFLGLTREAAARYSFLMSAPIIAGTGAYETAKLIRGDTAVPVEWGPLIVGMAAAFVTGLFAIGFLLRWLRTHRMTIFVAYRLVLAAIIVVVALSR